MAGKSVIILLEKGDLLRRDAHSLLRDQAFYRP